jgi:hypothetical protein
MPNRSKQKGSRFEREIVHLAQEFMLEAKRVPLSGAAEGFKDDIIIDNMRYEAKSRASGFKQIYNWLEPCFGLFLRADYNEPLVVLRAKDFMEILQQNEKA